MDPLSGAASVIAVIQLSASVLALSYKYISQVKDAPSDVARIVSEVSSLKAILSDLESNAKLEAPLQLCDGVLHELEKKLKSSRFRWPFESGRVDALLNKLSAQKSTFILAIAFESAETASETLNHVQSLRSIVETNEERKRHEKIIKWLATTDPATNHNLARSRHRPTTGQWFLESAKFQHWLVNIECLWVHAIPGAGKTIICSSAIEHVGKCAYYYFDFSDPLKQTVTSMLRSLIAQLSDPFPTCVQDLYSECNGREPSTSSLIRTLESFPHTFILIDALDECTEREEFFRIFQRLQRFSVLITSRKEIDIEMELRKFPNISLQEDVIDQDIQIHVRAALESDSRLKKWNRDIKVEIEDALTSQAHGMFRWVVCQLEVIRKCLRITNVRQALRSLPKTLDETYDRIFENLEYPEEAEMALGVLTYAARPMTVREVAEAIAVDNIPEARLPDPFDIVEICSSFVTAVDSSSDDTLHLRRFILSEVDDKILQFSHFSVKEYLSRRLEKNDLGRICIKYLLESSPDWNKYPLVLYAAKYWRKHWQGEDVELLFTQKLIDMLNVYDPDLPDTHAGLMHRYRNEDDIPSALYYACLLDIPQLCHLPDSSRKGKLKFPLQAAAFSGSIECVRALVEKGADINEQGGEFSNALRCAAYKNHIEVVRFLLSQGVRDEGERYGSALQAACVTNNTELVKLLDGNISAALRVAVANGNEDVVKELLSRGAVVQRMDWALQHAAKLGALGCIKVIIENGGELNAVSGEYGTPLQAATFAGHVGVVKYLLQAGSDPNIIGGSYCTALQACLDNYNPEIFESLLEAGADIHIRGGRHRGCLDAAIFHGLPVAHRLLDMGAEIHDNAFSNAVWMPEMIPKLLDLGANINSCDRSGNPALFLAIKNRETFELLLACGADVNIPGKDKTVLGSALKALPLETVAKVIEKADVNAMGEESALSIAIECCPEAVELLLDAGADVNLFRHTPAITAAVKADMVDMLLERGADVNVENETGETPLHAAIEAKNEEMIRKLVIAGADVNAGDPTPLEYAIESGCAVSFLLQMGADPSKGNILDACIMYNFDLFDMFVDLGASLDNALLAASERGDIKSARLLLSKGANCPKSTGLSGSPLQMAISRASTWEDPMIQELLVHEKDLDRPEGYNGTTLSCAIGRGLIDGVIDLLDRGADPDISGEFHGTPLQRAVGEGRKDIVDILLRRGADVNRISKNYGSPLQIAAKKGYRDIVVKLIKNGASQDGDLVPLCAATDEIAIILLEAGANINAVDREVGTALHVAARSANIPMMKLLLSRGASVNINAKGTALYYAVESNSLRAVKLLVEHGADVNIQGGDYGTPLQRACQNLNQEIAETLLSAGADINVIGGSRGCALESVCNTYDSAFAQWLIDCGAKVNVRTTGLGGSPLIWAARCRKFPLVQVLLKNGADINFQAGKYGTPLQAAARDPWPDMLRFILALKPKIDINIVAGKYGTALQAAATRSAEHVKILLDAGAQQLDGGKFGSALEAARQKKVWGAVRLLQQEV